MVDPWAAHRFHGPGLPEGSWTSGPGAASGKTFTTVTGELMGVPEQVFNRQQSSSWKWRGRFEEWLGNYGVASSAGAAAAARTAAAGEALAGVQRWRQQGQRPRRSGLEGKW